MRTATPMRTWVSISETFGIVGDGAVDLDAAVHRAGVHDERAGLGELQLVFVEAVEPEELARAREEAAGHALALHAQHHDDVGAFEALAHVVEDVRAPAFGADGHQRRRADRGARARREC